MLDFRVNSLLAFFNIFTCLSCVFFYLGNIDEFFRMSLWKLNDLSLKCISFYISVLCVLITIYHCRQRDNLEDMLRDLTPERIKIAKCMVFCVKNADCAEEVCTQSISIACI